MRKQIYTAEKKFWVNGNESSMSCAVQLFQPTMKILLTREQSENINSQTFVQMKTYEMLPWWEESN